MHSLYLLVIKLATLYFDLGSPYGYLAAERVAAGILGGPAEFEPILLGAIFHYRGRGSWSETDARDDNLAELAQRTRQYGLAPFAWPDGWPGDGLAAMRAATWASRLGAGERFALAAYRRAFVDGNALTVGVLAEVADEVGLDGAALPDAIADPEIKAALRAATDGAWEAGVSGVPTLRLGDALFYGDDRLEAAAAAAG
jgi:2-hydroxychromene-2-carboxylate isomerase